MTQEKTERNERIRDLVAEGLTYQAIGDRFGISRERVRQIAPTPDEGRRVPAKRAPVEWECEGCGKTETRTRKRARHRYCSRACAGRASRMVDRDERFGREAEQLRRYAVEHDYIPGTTEYAQHSTGVSGSVSISTLAGYLDPGLIECGSYAAVMDRLYETAGLERPNYGADPLPDDFVLGDSS